MKLPILDLELHKPTKGSLAWYAGIGAMTTAGVIEWPLALIVVSGHVIAQNSGSPAVAGAAEGAESAA